MKISDIFWVITIIGGVLLSQWYFNPELFKESNQFQSETVVNGSVDIKLLEAKSYKDSNESSYYYYLFTDKGRLLINNDNGFDHALFSYVENNLLKTCKATVSKSLVDWEVNSITCGT